MKRILGIDYGDVRVGLAISDPLGITAQGLETLIINGSDKKFIAGIRKLMNEYDFKELAHAYPRGEKFLYSPFSKFSTADTLEFFESIGVKTYAQEDGRIFPESNSAKDVRNKMLCHLKKTKFLQEKVL